MAAAADVRVPCAMRSLRVRLSVTGEPWSERQVLNVQWSHSHMGKKRFESRKLAAVWLAKKVKKAWFAPDELTIYSCEWTNKFKPGRKGIRHWHVGHPNLAYMVKGSEEN